MDSAAYKSTVTAAFNRAAASYDRLGVEFFTPMGRRLIERAAPRPGDRVLDVGCGRGASLFPAAELVGPTGHVLGIDIAPAMIEEARAEAERQGATNVELQVLDGENPDLPAKSFDLVTGSYSVIFIPDAPAAMARYAKLLAENGRIAFTSPVFTDDTFPFLPPMFTDLIPQDLLRNLPAEWQPEALRRRFNSWLGKIGDLRRTMRHAGFRDVDVVDEPLHVVVDSGEAWVDWSHTQGMRLLWQHLPPAESQQLRERLIAALDALRDGDGPALLEVPVRYVTATVRH
ncbi:methyltransferase [Prauserella marina]|uniref:O-methyltransferase / aklanonic acid methyltransferase n=1 Tax=Prauserella marina TaxID=530584 RepID=A0A222VLW5_9PSEU|nr:methyltransferase domain-containing protein [Prauserella marina]ASR34877.1 methyltransferase [Prauserella marina]PWV85423.1 O-methyltransferase/aklanonic acid methyltransferase [Prauserella marina]SDC55156.1 O-methyltransferase / aklanonic acid methyltransferase [Prauserella marina]